MSMGPEQMSDEVFDIVQAVDEFASDIRFGESKFIESVVRKALRRAPLTPRQEQWIRDIHERNHL